MTTYAISGTANGIASQHPRTITGAIRLARRCAGVSNAAVRRDGHFIAWVDADGGVHVNRDAVDIFTGAERRAFRLS